MNKVNEELKNRTKFYEYMKNNIFYTTNINKINNPIKISKEFPIYIKNPNLQELNYISEYNHKKLLSFVSIFPDLQFLLGIRENFIEEKYFAFKKDIENIQLIYKRYIEGNADSKISQIIEANDVESFCKFLSSFQDDRIIVEVKNWEKIDKYIMEYYNCPSYNVEFLGYRTHFLEQYLNLFNIINLDLKKFQGIDLVSIDEVIFEPYYINFEYNQKFLNIISTPYIVDSFVKKESQIIDLFFIINTLQRTKYLKERRALIDFVTCLEFFLSTKSPAGNSKLQSQFKLKLKKCCEYIGYEISKNELADLYDYRSLIVHGNFKEFNNKTDEIVRKEWYKRYASKLGYKSGIYFFDNMDKENFIYCRFYEIFERVFKLYCEKNEDINELKEKIKKEDIDNFSFA